MRRWLIAFAIVIGVATTTDPGEEASQLLERADKVLSHGARGRFIGYRENVNTIRGHAVVLS